MLTISVVSDNTVSAADWRGISQHLRGAQITECFASSGDGRLPGNCRAIVFVGLQPVEKIVIERALGAGSHVLLATDPCLSVADLQALSGVAQKSDLQFAVANPDRYLASRQLIKQQIDSQLSQLGLIRVHRWEPAREGCILSVAGLPGPLVRDLDLVMWLAGESPQIVYALDNSANRSTAAAGCHFQIHLGFARGMALIDYSSRLPAGGGYHRVSVIGATGAACADDQQNVQLLFRGGPPQAFQTGEGTRHLAILIQNFVDAIETGQELTTTVNAWTDVFHIVESVRQSLDTHRAIHRKGA